MCFSFTYCLSGISALLAEIALQQSGEACTMASFVLCHFVNGVVNGVEAGSLGVLGDAELVLAGTCLSGSTLFKVGLRVPNALTEQLGKAACVISLLEGITLEGLCNLGITLAISLTGHGEIHTNFAALAIEVVAQVLNHLFADTFGFAIANLVLSGILGNFALLQFGELTGWSLADGATLWWFRTFVNVAANGANEFFVHNCFCLMG